MYITASFLGKYTIYIQIFKAYNFEDVPNPAFLRFYFKVSPSLADFVLIPNQ